MTTSQKGRIFISYRRADSAGYAGRIYDRLAAHFSEAAIFMDVDKIPAGLDFAEVLESEVQACDVLVALIGKQWLNIKDAEGKRRLDNPQDFVRIEIAAALRRGIRVIPVLFDETPMPRATDLPHGLKRLAQRNAVFIQHRAFHANATHLIKQLELALAAAEESRIVKTKELEEKRIQKKRQAEIETLLAQADIAIQLEGWKLAKEKLEELLALAPGHTQGQVKLEIAEHRLLEIKQKEETRNTVEKTKHEAIKKAAKEKSEREAAEKAAKEKAEREAAEKAEHEDVQRKARKAKQQERKKIQRKKSYLLITANLSMATKNWSLAQKSLNAILALDSEHSDAKKKLALIEQKTHSANKQNSKHKSTIEIIKNRPKTIPDDFSFKQNYIDLKESSKPAILPDDPGQKD